MAHGPMLTYIHILLLALFAKVVISDQQVLTQNEGGFGAIRGALSKAEIIPQVLDDFKPKCRVVPIYQNGKDSKSVALGNKFKTPTTKVRPGLRIYCPEVSNTPGLTIALTDPDARSRKNPDWSEMCHWIVALPIPDQGSYFDFQIGSEIIWGDGSELVEYKPPGPPPKTGYHRYVFVLLEGDNTNLTAPSDRKHWGTGRKRHGVRDWAEIVGLQVVGANYFVEKNKKQ